MDTQPKLNFNLKSKAFLLTTLFTLFTYSLSQKCRTYTCSTTKDDFCLRLNYTLEIDSVEAKGCDDSVGKFCPAYDLSSKSEVKCKDNLKLPLRQYPGGPCKTKDDCMNLSDCSTEGKCAGKPEGLNCTRHDECFFGLACYKKTNGSISVTCNALRALNSQGCESEFECSMGQGCFNGVCTDYYSLPVGINLGDNNYQNSQSFCASGHDRHGICDSLKNINENEVISDELVKCDELNPCRYSSINGTITETNVCNCGKSADSSRYCPIFGGNKYYKAAVKQIKEIINANRTNCNTLERDGICNFYKVSGSNDVAKLTYDTLRTKIASFHEFSNAQQCIQKIFYPLYNKDYDKQPVDPVDPSGKKCPFFRCVSDDNSKKKICAMNLFSETKNGTLVNLFKTSCDWDNEFCNFDRSYLGIETKESLCKQKDSKVIANRYPGESCGKDEDCYLLNGVSVEGLGKCLSSKVCSGFASATNCTHTSQCNPSLYCKNNKEKNIATCQSQESEKSICNSIYDCKNNLVCYNNLCSNLFYASNAGEIINTKNFTDIERPLAASLLCKFGEARKIDDNSSVCLMKKQIDAVDIKQGNLVPCVPDQFCNYTLTDGNNITDAFTLGCECGFNPNGQGYCKAGHNISNFIFYVFD
jgi:hypothetical protein